MSDRGIPVFNTPGANANSVKELVLAGLLTPLAAALYIRAVNRSPTFLEWVATSAIIIAHFTENWGFYTLLTSLPMFMR